MIILKDAYVLTLDPKNEFGRYSLLIDEERIVDITKSDYPVKHDPDNPSEHTKINRWMERYSSNVEVIDCCNKIIMPPFANSCSKSEGALVKYLLRNRGYEKSDDNLYTDFMFNYIYQELQTGEMKQDLAGIYNYSFSRALKSGVVSMNEFSLRKDINHLDPVTSAGKLTSQKINVCYPVKHDIETLLHYKYLNPANYLTDESELTIYDISQLTELKKNNSLKLFLEVSTNKEVVEKFKRTFNKPIILLLDEYGLIDETATLINPIYLTYDEIKVIADKKANIVICPTDLQYFTSRYFSVDEFVNHGIKFSIATGWLGEDLLEEIRLLRSRYKELNLSNEEYLMSIIKTPQNLYFSDAADDEETCCISPNKTANLIFIDLTDVRFQLFPENFTHSKICDFIVDNLYCTAISDVMINGDFKVRDNRTVYFNEFEIIQDSLRTRQRLYKVGKYKEISERSTQRKSIEKLDIRYSDEDDIKLFTESGESQAGQQKEIKDEFRIKGKIPVFSRKSSSSQKTLFEEEESGGIILNQDAQETPEINLLFTEIDDEKNTDDEIIYSKIADARILKQAGMEKPVEKTEKPKTESKIELPKNVKLRFGDD